MTTAAARTILERLEAQGMRLGLEATRRLLERLGSPQESFPPVLVAGTNGKGSTAALLASMARAAGYRTGLYVSPHLEVVEERIRVDGRRVPERRLEELLREVVEAGEALVDGPPTYFEALTAAAILHFARERVELAVLEVGMGGRLDATNVVDPVLGLVTSVGLEHECHLGTDLATIAGEKGGIFRSGVPALAWEQEPEVRAGLLAAARRAGADLRWAGPMVELTDGEDGWGGQRLSLATPGGRYELRLGLPGSHQARNLALAVLAAEALRDRGWPRLGRQAVEAGAQGCAWPGRLEAVPLPGGAILVLDVAHNPPAVAALAAFLELREARYDLLFGVLEDKRVEAMLPLLARRAGRVVLTAPASSRALAPEALPPLVEGPEVEVEPRLEAALDRLLDEPADGYLVAGSVYLVGPVRRMLRERFGVPGEDAVPYEAGRASR